MSKRPYTGYDGDASRKREGLETFVNIVCFLSGGGVWNNGTLAKRNKRGKSSRSVHATGRAVDFSWRDEKGKDGRVGAFGNYKQAKEIIDFLTANATALQIEAIFDYHPRPWGTGYKCDRDRTVKYTKRAFKGAPGGDWFHVEIAPGVADDPAFFDKAFKKILGGAAAAEKPKIEPVESDVIDNPEPGFGDEPPAPLQYPGRPITVGSDKFEWVKAIQKKVGAKPDGAFGPKTEQAVKDWQSKHGLTVDGKVGKRTWAAMFG